MDIDRVEGQVEFGGALLAVFLAELDFLPFEFHELLVRGCEQVVAPVGVVKRVFRHGRNPQELRHRSEQGRTGSVPQDCGIMTAPRRGSLMQVSLCRTSIE